MGTLLWKYADTIQTRLKVVCLPADASVEVSAESDSRGGVLWLRSWPALGVGCENDSCNLVAEQLGRDWKLTLRAHDHSVPAEVTLTLTLAWPGNQTQHLIVPFPATGAVFLDPEGRRMQPHQRIDVNDLLGSRLRLLPGQHRRHWHVCLLLRDSAQGRPLLTRTLEYGVSEEIRLFDYIRPIQEMLACTESLDATVTIECQELNTSVASIQVGRYTAKLLCDLETGAVCFPHAERISEGGIETLGIFTVPISHPDVAPEQLKQARSEDSYLRRWWFNPGSRDPGPWFIFPDSTSRSAFRPFIWAIGQPYGQPQPELSGLSLALSLVTTEERYAALSAVAEHLYRSGETPRA
ncbi:MULTISPECIES: STY4851/ECs_5259 family protein [unclassified Pseudomonas]|uniref:STY4851/ECs_5259 family protein n=1 Tax=Pseudomonas TaxID=286 RepID=UPI001C49C8F6